MIFGLLVTSAMVVVAGERFKITRNRMQTCCSGKTFLFRVRIFYRGIMRPRAEFRRRTKCSALGSAKTDPVFNNKIIIIVPNRFVIYAVVCSDNFVRLSTGNALELKGYMDKVKIFELKDCTEIDNKKKNSK